MTVAHEQATLGAMIHLRSTLRHALRHAVFVLTPALAVPLAPLRLLDLLFPRNPASLGIARLVNRTYPTWFHLAPPPGAEGVSDAEYVESRRRSARVNLERYGVPLRARRFLEVGCGTGAKTALYREHLGGCFAVGTDVDFESLQFRERAGAPPLLLTPPYVLPLRDGVFDLVLCEEVLEHVSEPERLLGEIARVLAPGGRALILIGPMYLHAKGPHLQTHLRVLWPHVLFSRATLRRLLESTPLDQGLLTHAKAWEVFETLNGHGEARYRRAITGCGLVIDRLERIAEYPLLASVPVVGALYRKSVRAVLRKPV